VTPEQRRRAGLAVAARLRELNKTVPEVARHAGISPSTIRSLINGEHWPNPRTVESVHRVLGWPDDELLRRALDGDTRLHGFRTIDLVREVCRRLEAEEDADFVGESPKKSSTRR
jgi:predicted transcriptional regulator